MLGLSAKVSSAMIQTFSTCFNTGSIINYVWCVWEMKVLFASYKFQWKNSSLALNFHQRQTDYNCIVLGTYQIRLVTFIYSSYFTNCQKSRINRNFFSIIIRKWEYAFVIIVKRQRLWTCGTSHYRCAC